mgnify:CR=1 FL=1
MRHAPQDRRDFRNAHPRLEHVDCPRLDRFDGAIADFSEAYADINERDHAAYVAAIAAGRVTVPAEG